MPELCLDGVKFPDHGKRPGGCGEGDRLLFGGLLLCLYVCIHGSQAPWQLPRPVTSSRAPRPGVARRAPRPAGARSRTDSRTTDVCWRPAACRIGPDLMGPVCHKQLGEMAFPERGGGAPIFNGLAAVHTYVRTKQYSRFPWYVSYSRACNYHQPWQQAPGVLKPTVEMGRRRIDNRSRIAAGGNNGPAAAATSPSPSCIEYGATNRYSVRGRARTVLAPGPEAEQSRSAYLNGWLCKRCKRLRDSPP